LQIQQDFKELYPEKDDLISGIQLKKSWLIFLMLKWLNQMNMAGSYL